MTVHMKAVDVSPIENVVDDSPDSGWYCL
jgi:hypothetical protein